MSCSGLSLRRALPLVAALLMLSSIGLPGGGSWPWRAQRSGSGGGGGGRAMAGTASSLADGDDDDTDEPSLVVRQVSRLASVCSSCARS